MPAYLDPNLRPQDLVTGVSFASGGAGYDPLTSKVAVCIFILYNSLTLDLLIFWSNLFTFGFSYSNS